MPLYDFFKRFLGLPDNNEPKSNFDESLRNNGKSDENSYRDEFWKSHNENFDENVRNPDLNDGTHFNIFTDPLEMHKYFEHQMNEILKSFSSMFGENSGQKMFTFDHLLPSLPDSPQNELPGRSLRDKLLKPGYDNTNDKNYGKDSDLDGKINVNDLDLLLKSKSPNEEKIVPFEEKSILPKVRTFGQSVSTKTIRRPDGSIETHRTLRDNSGTEETTVIRQFGDKQYTLTIKTDKNGRQEKFEDLVNIDEKDLPKFTDHWNSNENSRSEQDVDLNKWFPYDKFFK